MIYLLLTGVVAVQAAPAPTVPAPASPACRAADGRYVMSCFPKGTVRKMGAPPHPRSGRLLVKLPEAKATAKPE